MMLDLTLDDAHQELQRSIGGWLASPGVQATEWSDELWGGLAALGVLGIATQDGGGDALDLVVSHETLGEFATTGPLASAVYCAQVLPAAESSSLASGDLIPGLALGDLVPWGDRATLFVGLDEDGGCWRGVPSSPPEPLRSLGGEPWAQVSLERGDELGRHSKAIELAHLAVAAWLVGAGNALVERTAAHARNRHQFGRPIGQFQSVAHRIARCEAEVVSARDQTRIAAWRHAEGREVSTARSRRVAARAALSCAYAAHQVHGALGFSSESGIGTFSAAIRDRISHPPAGSHGLSST